MSPITNKYLSYGVLNLDSHTSKNTNLKRNSNKELKFNKMVNNGDTNTGLCSPPLWRTSPTRTSQSPQELRNNYKNMSPASKAEAVARGQKELMDMVKNMPESCYELTLKDIVEHHQEQKKGVSVEDEVKKLKSFERKGVVKMSESGVNGEGYLLKIGFLFGSKKTKKNSGTPRASVDGSVKRKGRTSVDKEKEWWKIGFSSEGSRSGSCKSSSSSSNSSSSSTRRNSETNSCWSLFWTKRSKKEPSCVK